MQWDNTRFITGGGYPLSMMDASAVDRDGVVVCVGKRSARAHPVCTPPPASSERVADVALKGAHPGPRRDARGVNRGGSVH